MTDIFSDAARDGACKVIIAKSFKYTLSPNKFKYEVEVTAEDGTKYIYDEYNVDPSTDLTGVHEEARVITIDFKNKRITIEPPR